MKTNYFKINDFDLNREYNNYFWDRALSLPNEINRRLANGINNRYEENYRIREEDLNIKLFHIFYILKKYVDAGDLSFPNNIWIGIHQYSMKFKNKIKKKGKDFGYISGDFDLLVGGLVGSTLQTDNIIGIETKVFRYDVPDFNEDYKMISDIPNLKEKYIRNDGIMPGLKQIISYKYFCNKVILFYIAIARPAPSHIVIPQALNGDVIRKAMGQIKNKYKDKIVHIPDDVGFCISGIVQVPGKDSLDSGTPTTPDIIKNPSRHDGLLPDREDFIDILQKRLERAETI